MSPLYSCCTYHVKMSYTSLALAGSRSAGWVRASSSATNSSDSPSNAISRPSRSTLWWSRPLPDMTRAGGSVSRWPVPRCVCAKWAESVTASRCGCRFARRRSGRTRVKNPRFVAQSSRGCEWSSQPRRRRQVNQAAFPGYLGGQATMPARAVSVRRPSSDLCRAGLHLPASRPCPERHRGPCPDCRGRC